MPDGDKVRSPTELDLLAKAADVLAARDKLGQATARLSDAIGPDGKLGVLSDSRRATAARASSRSKSTVPAAARSPGQPTRAEAAAIQARLAKELPQADRHPDGTVIVRDLARRADVTPMAARAFLLRDANRVAVVREMGYAMPEDDKVRSPTEMDLLAKAADIVATRDKLGQATARLSDAIAAFLR